MLLKQYYQTSLKDVKGDGAGLGVGNETLPVGF